MSPATTKISAIVLAAGSSSRMGPINKLLLPHLGQKSIIRSVVERILRSDVKEVIIVLGHQAERVKEDLSELNIRFVTNPHFTSGMTSSIQCGAAAAGPDTSGILICLGDMPLLTPEDYRRVTAAVTGERQIISPVYEGQKGHPVFFSHHFIPDILAHNEPEGCKSIVTRNKVVLDRVISPNAHILQDIDRPEDYDKLPNEG